MRPHITLPKTQTARAFGIVLLVTAVGGIYLWRVQTSGPPRPTPEPTPVPTIRSAAGDLRTLPDTPAAVRDRIASELEGFFTDLYERVFLPPLPAPSPEPDEGPSPQPTPIPRPPATELFAEGAAEALRSSENVYGTTSRETVFTGNVTFDGILTTRDGVALDALLDVTFRAEGRIELRPQDPETNDLGAYRTMRLEQDGRLELTRSEGGWRIVGFDIDLRSEALIPQSPAPSAAGLGRSVAARWMP